MSIGRFLEILSQQILVGIIFVGRLGVPLYFPYLPIPQPPYFPTPLPTYLPSMHPRIHTSMHLRINTSRYRM